MSQEQVGLHIIYSKNEKGCTLKENKTSTNQLNARYVQLESVRSDANISH